MTAADRLIQVIAQALEVDPSTLTLDTRAEDVPKWDSLAHVNLIGEVEEAFEVSIPIEAFGEISSVRDFLNHLPSS